jgi:hypothetical protein
VQQITEKSNGENKNFKLRIDTEVTNRKQESNQQEQQRGGRCSASISKQDEAIPWLNAIEPMNEVTTINSNNGNDDNSRQNQSIKWVVPIKRCQRTRNPLQSIIPSSDKEAKSGRK